MRSSAARSGATSTTGSTSSACILPPLRHRPEDIGPLVRRMVARFGTRYGKRLFGVCPETLRVLEAYPWPANIRQLENVVQQAVLTSHGSELKLHHLSPAIAVRSEAAASTAMPGGFGGTLRQISRVERTGQHSPGTGKGGPQPHPHRTAAGGQPRHTLQEDEEVRLAHGTGAAPSRSRRWSPFLTGSN